MPNASLFPYWYLHLPNLVLLTLICLLVARLVLSVMIDDGSAIMRLVGAVTNPVVASVGAVTPRIVPLAAIVVCAILWLVAARIILFMVAMAMGVRLWG